MSFKSEFSPTSALEPESKRKWINFTANFILKAYLNKRKLHKIGLTGSQLKVGKIDPNNGENAKTDFYPN